MKHSTITDVTGYPNPGSHYEGLSQNELIDTYQDEKDPIKKWAKVLRRDKRKRLLRWLVPSAVGILLSGVIICITNLI